MASVLPARKAYTQEAHVDPMIQLTYSCVKMDVAVENVPSMNRVEERASSRSPSSVAYTTTRSSLRGPLSSMRNGRGWAPRHLLLVGDDNVTSRRRVRWHDATLVAADDAATALQLDEVLRLVRRGLQTGGEDVGGANVAEQVSLNPALIFATSIRSSTLSWVCTTNNLR